MCVFIVGVCGGGMRSCLCLVALFVCGVWCANDTSTAGSPAQVTPGACDTEQQKELYILRISGYIALGVLLLLIVIIGILRMRMGMKAAELTGVEVTIQIFKWRLMSPGECKQICCCGKKKDKTASTATAASTASTSATTTQPLPGAATAAAPGAANTNALPAAGPDGKDISTMDCFA